MKLYGKTLRFKRGIFLNLFLTFRCTLKCDYCILKLPTKIYPKSKEVGLDVWKDLISNFSLKIKEVSVSGGEPTLYPYFAEFVNWLLDKGYHVKIYSNLTNPSPINDIKKSYRLIINATNHKHKAFLGNYLEMKHRVNVIELGERTLSFSRVNPILDKPNKIKGLVVGPDTKLFQNCAEMNQYYKTN
jgi:organic radical activating enzyme